MHIYWEIKTVASMAMIVAPLLALFNCPCAVSSTKDHGEMDVSRQQNCCQSVNHKEDCCDSERNLKSKNGNTHAKHKCGDSPCTCVVGEMRAVAPTPQRYEIMPQTHACEVAPSDSRADLLTDILAVNMFRLPHQAHTPTHLMKCVFLC